MRVHRLLEYLTLMVSVLAPQSTPAITALYPNAGPPSSVVSAVIRGTNLANASAVNFSGSGVSAAILAGGTATNLPISITVGANAAQGPQTVTVTTPGGTSQAFSNFFVVGVGDLRPTINPLTAPVAGLSQSVAPYFGSAFTMTINGQSFAPDAQVLANGAPILTTFVNANQLTAPVPASVRSLLGITDLAVRQKQNAGSNNLVISNAAPLRIVERGDIDGSRTISIDDANAVALNVGGVSGDAPLARSAGDFNLNDAINIADAVSLGLFVKGADRNLAVPGILSTSPSPAIAGQLMTMNGTGFPAASADLEVAFTVAGGAVERVTPILQPPPAGQTQSVSLSVTTPVNAISGPLQIYRLDSPAASQPLALSVDASTPPLLLTSVAPLSAAGGSTLTLTGSGFAIPASNNTINFNGASIPATNGSSTSLTVTVPNQAICGGVTVQTAQGTSNAKPFIKESQPCAQPVLTGISKGSTGQVVLVEGTGFDALHPQNNEVRFPITGGTTPGAVLQSGQTQLHVRVPDTAIAGNVTAIVNGVTSNAIAFSYPPAIKTITPAGGSKGQTSVPVTINGSGFVPGSTTIGITGTGVSFANYNVVSAGQLTATFTVSVSATIGARSLTVTTPGGTSAAETFTVFGAPTITSITPSALATNNSNPVTITGTGFVGGTNLSVDGGVGVQNLNIVNLTSLTASLSVPNALGTRNITASNTAGPSTNFSVFVTGLQGFTPISGEQGESFPVNLTGCFVPNQTSVTVSGGDVSVTNVQVGENDPNDPGVAACYPYSRATATINIGNSAVPGVRNISVTTPAGTIPSFTTFTVFALPVIDSITPAGGTPGTFVNVQFDGFGFIQGKVSVDAQDLPVSNISVQDAYGMSAQITIPGGTVVGPRLVTVTTDNGDTSNPVTFTVVGAPVVNSYSPTVGYAGGPMFMTFVGQNFVPGGTTVSVSGTGITAGPRVVSSDLKTLSVTLTIAAGAATGSRTVTVTTTGGSVNRNITINPVPPAPTFTSITPSSGPQNGFVTVTFSGSNFINGGTVINISDGIELTNLAFPSSSAMTAFFKLTVGGVQTLSVTTAGGTTAALPFTVAPDLLTSATHFTASHFAGGPGGSGTTDAAGTAAKFNGPQKVWSDGVNLYVADQNNHVIRKVVIATGVTTTVAGMPGVPGTTDGVGTAARFTYPAGVWGDGTNLYVADSTNHAIRKIVLATGTVSTFAGSPGSSGLTNATGTSARFSLPYGICGDGTNLFVADSGNNEIRKIVISTGAVTLLSGSSTGASGPTDGTGGAAGTSRFFFPQGIFCAGANLYVADSANHKIRTIVASTGAVTTLAGNASQSAAVDGTGGAAGTARFNYPVGLWGDGTNLFVTDNNNALIRKVAISNGQTTTLSGVALDWKTVDGTGSPGGTARFNGPAGIFGVGSNLYVTENFGHTVRSVVIANGNATTLAGTPTASGLVNATGTAARFSSPYGVIGDGTNLYIGDSTNNAIRKAVISNSAVTTLTGANGQGATDGAANVAQFRTPANSGTDGANLYVADSDNHTIRKVVSATGATTTLAGTANSSGYLDLVGTAAKFSSPQGAWSDGTNLYVADSGNHRIRKIVIATGAVTTFAGTGNNGWNDGTGTDDAFFNGPTGIWGDGTNLYVADTLNYVIRKINIATQVVTTIAGYPSVPALLDGPGLFNSRFVNPRGIWGDQFYLYVADDNAIRRIAIDTNYVTTISGGHTGADNGMDRLAGFSSPHAIWANGADLYVADSGNNAIRKVTPTTLATPTLSSISPASGAHNTTVAVTLTGTNFVPGATTVNAGALITTSSVTVTGPGTLLVNFVISNSAALGSRNVTVTTSAGTSTSVAFTVN